MKIKINPDQYNPFLKALKRAADVSKVKTTIPELGAALITTTENGILIRATNIDQGFDISVECEIEKKGECMVSARDILQIASIGKSMSIAVNENKAVIECNGEFQLPIFSSENFPPFPKLADPKEVQFSRDELKKIIRVGHAMSTPRDSRYTLQGICFNPVSKEGVASDGKRLAVTTPKPSSGYGSIVPDFAVRIIAGLVDDGEDIFKCQFSQGAASFQSGNFVFYTQLIEGNYPNFTPILPKSDFKISVNRESLIDAITRARVAYCEKDCVKMVLYDSTLDFHVEGKNAQSSVSLTLNQKSPKKGDFAISLNSVFLKEAAQAMEGEEVSLEFTDNLSPMAVRGDIYAVIMPMRTA